MKKIILSLLCCLVNIAVGAQTYLIDLSGTWECTPEGMEKTTVQLPGTLDTNGIGNPPTSKDETTHLTRHHSFSGKVVYERTFVIPTEWDGKPLTMMLERTKPTEVSIDGKEIGTNNDISTPQRYELPTLKAGEHTLRIAVDNASGLPGQLYASSHALTEDTQTNWNGIIGRMEIVPQGTYDVKAMPLTWLAEFDNFHVEGQHFYANGKRIFLRGKHDACVWPLTGHVPMDVKSWTDYFATCAEYGINHVRFHSWCPPEAAFVVADQMGIYLQPELPFWGDFNEKDTTLMTFLHKEGVNILREYGHHPSFVLFALGNELWGSIDRMKQFVDDFREIAPTKLYTFGSNYYLGYQGIQPGMDYFVTCRIGGEAWGSYNTHTRGSFSFADAFDGGMINNSYPNSAMNFDEACDAATRPIISHETGQFQTYPDYDEIKKYTGVLYPYNLEIFKQRLEKAGMADQAKDFHHASGRWSTLLYKADIEMDLRTDNMAGFQLLDIQDYPGQGSAYVGILDAFMDSKGITTPEEWRQWCAPIVILGEMERFCYTTGEEIPVSVSVANYGSISLSGNTVELSLVDAQGEEVNHQSLHIDNEGQGLLRIGKTTLAPSPTATDAQEYKLKLRIGDKQAPISENSYDLWIYPDTPIQPGKVIVTREMTDKIGDKLRKGAKVLWMPVIANDSTNNPSLLDNTIGPLFQTDYWNYRMFRTICEKNNKTVSPGTLGILTDPSHDLFRGFPTEEHTNWQWFPVIKNSRPLILDKLPTGERPLVQVIDNIERNHKLGLVMEYKIGKGKLLICMSDLEAASAKPEGKAFYRSLLTYMNGERFNPKASHDLDTLLKALTGNIEEQEMEKLDNISQY